MSYSIIQKSKELGVRKVLGASTLNIGVILSKEFLALILIAFALTLPLAYLSIERWMEQYAYQVDISWWIYVLGVVLSISVALLTVAAKVWKAIRANPVESLRYE